MAQTLSISGKFHSLSGGRKSAIEVKTSLRKQGILIRHFDKPGLSDHIRISIGTRQQIDKLALP